MLFFKNIVFWKILFLNFSRALGVPREFFSKNSSNRSVTSYIKKSLPFEPKTISDILQGQALFKGVKQYYLATPKSRFSDRIIPYFDGFDTKHR